MLFCICAIAPLVATVFILKYKKLIAPSVGGNCPLLAARKLVALVLARLNARPA